MNPDPSKLRQQHREEQNLSFNQTHQKQGHNFSSLEEMIRYDVEQTTVPPKIVERLNESIAREPKPGRPWWRRLFSHD